MMNRGEHEVTFGRNKRCVHDIRHSQVHKKIIDGRPEELETILFSFKSGNGMSEVERHYLCYSYNM